MSKDFQTRFDELKLNFSTEKYYELINDFINIDYSELLNLHYPIENIQDFHLEIDQELK